MMNGRARDDEQWMSAESPPEGPVDDRASTGTPPVETLGNRAAGVGEKPSLTPEQLAQLAQSHPSQTVTWPVKPRDVGHGDWSPMASRSDALQSIMARQTVRLDPTVGDNDDDEIVRSEPMEAVEGEASTVSMISADRAESAGVETFAADVTQDLPDRGPIIGLNTTTPRPSRQDLLSAGTQRLPELRTASSEEALANTEADFVLREVIGRGGQGEVWRAWQTSLAREVAIKRLTHVDGNVLEFLKEAYTSAELDHPNIVPVYDLGRVNDGGGGAATAGHEDAALHAMERAAGARPRGA